MVLQVRLASANIASGIDHRTWTPSLDRVADGVARLGADVVALQEVDHLLPRTGAVDQADALARACAADRGADRSADRGADRGGQPWGSRFAAAVHGTPGDPATLRPAAPGARPDEPSYGVALIARHDVAAWDELHLAAGHGRLPVVVPGRLLLARDEPRVALAGTVATPVGPLTVVCTHLSFSPLRAVRQLRRLRSWTASMPRPLVLLGDLNLPGRVPPAITGWRPLVEGPTYPAHRPRVQLDHVLLDDPRRRLQVLYAGIEDVPGTDHRAVVVDLSSRA